MSGITTVVILSFRSTTVPSSILEVGIYRETLIDCAVITRAQDATANRVSRSDCTDLIVVVILIWFSW